MEASESAGGLASSFVDHKGFAWDIGGHVQFSHYDYFDDAMNAALGKEGWLHHERKSWVWIADQFVPYPFQNNLRYLPRELMAKAVRGLATRPPRTPSPRSGLRFRGSCRRSAKGCETSSWLRTITKYGVIRSSGCGLVGSVSAWRWSIYHARSITFFLSGTTSPGDRITRSVPPNLAARVLCGVRSRTDWPFLFSVQDLY